MACINCFREIKAKEEKNQGKAICPRCGEVWILIISENKGGILKNLPEDEYYWKAMGPALDPFALTEEEMAHLGRS